MEYFVLFARVLGFGLFNSAWIFTVLYGVERLWPKGRPSATVQLSSLRFWAIYAVAGAVLATAFKATSTVADIEPLIIIRMEDHLPPWAAYVVGPALTVIAYDFFNYWMHRAQHKWFWAQHAVHHSIRDLSAINSYFHWTEEMFRIAFIALPSAVLFDLEIGGATIVSTLLLAAYGNFIHSASTLHFGKTGRLILADNRWHRIHHSIERGHFNKNFGTGVTFWDRLFGTAYYPENEEWPDVGVRGEAEISTVGNYLWRPFRRSIAAQSDVVTAVTCEPAIASLTDRQAG